MNKEGNNTGFRPVFYEQYSRRSQYRILAAYRKNDEKEQSGDEENVTQDDDNTRYHAINECSIIEIINRV